MMKVLDSEVRRATLRTIPLFDELDPIKFDHLLEQMTLERFERKAIIFQEGQLGSECYFVAHGLCALIKGLPSAQPVCVEVISSGDPVGIAAVLDNIKFPLTLKAIQECVVVVFSKDCFVDLIKADARLEQRLARITRQRFRHVQTRFHQIASSSAKQKILATLATVIERLQICHFPVDLDLSKTELAELASVEPETVIRFSKDEQGREILKTLRRGSLTILKSPSELLG